MIVELNRRLVKGYTHYKDEPKVANLKKSVNEYNKQLWLLGVRDHQVEYAKFSIAKVVFTLIYRLGKLTIMSFGTLPGLILFAPVFAASKIISIKKSREALAASTVKLQGRDVMATWKLLVALAFAPTLYALYTILLTYWTYRNRVQGHIPDWVPLWMVVSFGVIFFPSVTFAALRFGEIGMDILKSIRPLVLSLNPTSANTLHRLREKREQLSKDVTDVINTFGPELFPDFDHTRIVADPFHEGVASGSSSPRTPKSPWSHSRASSSDTSFPPTAPPHPKRSHTAGASIGGGSASSAHGHLPRNESFKDLGNIGLFATRPPSRNRSTSSSRSSSMAGLAPSSSNLVKGFKAIGSKESLDEVSKRIRGAMQLRGQERNDRRASEGSWDMGSSGALTPNSEETNAAKKEV